MKLRSLLVIPICAQMGWSKITLTLKDPKGNPIAGVACGQGSKMAISNDQGVLTYNEPVGVLRPVQGPKNAPLFHLPIANGEKASVTVFDSRGHRVASHDVRLGENFDFASAAPGVFHIRVQGRDLSISQSVVTMGQGMSFTGVSRDASVGSGNSLGKVAAGVSPIVCSKPGYATKTYMLNDGDVKDIGFGMQIGRQFDPNAYTKYEGFNLEVVEDFNTADWPNGLTWDANHVSNDVVWEPSDAGFESNKTRFSPSQLKFKDNALAMVMELKNMPGSISHSESDNCDPTSEKNKDCPNFFAKERDTASGEIRAKENAFRYGRYEITIDPPDMGTATGNADGFIAAMFTWFTPRDRYWREIDVEILGNVGNAYLSNLFFANNEYAWSASFENKNMNTKPAGAFNPRAANRYAFVWLPGVVKWYVNDELVRTFGEGMAASQKAKVSKLSSKVVMNFWILNDAVGGLGKGNKYPLEAKFDNFRYYRWDEDGDKVKYPETP